MRRFKNQAEARQAAFEAGGVVICSTHQGKRVELFRFPSGDSAPADKLTPDYIDVQREHAREGRTVELELEQLDSHERAKAELALRERCVEIREAADQVRVKYRRVLLHIERPNSLLQREGLFKAAQELSTAAGQLMALTAPESVQRALAGTRKAS